VTDLAIILDKFCEFTQDMWYHQLVILGYFSFCVAMVLRHIVR